MGLGPGQSAFSGKAIIINKSLTELRAHLSASPLLGLTLTFVFSVLKSELATEFNRYPLLNSVLVSILALAIIRWHRHGAQRIGYVRGLASGRSLAATMAKIANDLLALNPYVPGVQSLVSSLFSSSMDSVSVAPRRSNHWSTKSD